MVECDELFVLHQREGIALDIVHVAADEQGRTHHTPYAKVSLVLLVGESATHLKHIHIVIVAGAGICREVEALSDDALYRLPTKVNILRRAP